MRAKDLNDLVRYCHTKFQISTANSTGKLSTRLLGMVAGGSQPCQGWGRGFESHRPLQILQQLQDVAGSGQSAFAAAALRGSRGGSSGIISSVRCAKPRQASPSTGSWTSVAWLPAAARVSRRPRNAAPGASSRRAHAPRRRPTSLMATPHGRDRALQGVGSRPRDIRVTPCASRGPKIFECMTSYGRAFCSGDPACDLTAAREPRVRLQWFNDRALRALSNREVRPLLKVELPCTDVARIVGP
jgi:hypothetical protein